MFTAQFFRLITNTHVQARRRFFVSGFWRQQLLAALVKHDRLNHCESNALGTPLTAFHSHTLIRRRVYSTATPVLLAKVFHFSVLPFVLFLSIPLFFFLFSFFLFFFCSLCAVILIPNNRNGLQRRLSLLRSPSVADIRIRSWIYFRSYCRWEETSFFLLLLLSLNCVFVK